MTTEQREETIQEEEVSSSDEGMTFTEHLEELRYRLFRIIIAAFVGFLICYLFKERLFSILMDPLVKVLPEASSMIFTGLPEAFFTYLKVSLVAGIFWPARTSSTRYGSLSARACMTLKRSSSYPLPSFLLRFS